MKKWMFFTAFLLVACHAPAPKPPNVILIIADDLGWGDLSCYGNASVQTPNIDRMAAEGLQLYDFHSSSAIGGPTRAALFTGRYPQRAGIEGNLTASGHRHVSLGLDAYTLAELLRAHNYATGLFGKWHLGYKTDFTPVFHGFEEFIGFVSGNIDYLSHIDAAGFPDWWNNEFLRKESGYVTDLITEHSIEFIDKNKANPFFLCIAHQAPHYPYQTRHDKADRAAGNVKMIYGSRPDKDIVYNQMLTDLDKSIGEIFSALDNHMLAENTLVFLCSDNGPTGPGSAGDLRGAKAELWEGGIRVPAIAWWPGKIAPHSRCDQFITTMDLFPTIAAAASIACPDSVDGVDSSPALFSADTLAQRPFFWRYRGGKAVRLGDWKYIHQDNEQGLYNLADDIQEQENLLDVHHQKVKALQDLLKNWETEMDNYSYITK